MTFLTVLLCIVLIIALLLLAANLWTRSLGHGVEELIPQAGEIMPVTGGALHYIDLGPKDAQTLVLIHGLSGQLQHFTYALADRLAQDFRVIAVDRPGCGYSRRDSKAQAGVAEQGRMIGELLDNLGVEATILVGHSLGGAISLAMALDRPEKTAGLALLCPVTLPQSDAPEAFAGLEIRSDGLRKLISHTIAVPTAKRTAEKVLELVFAPESAPEDFLTRGGGALGLRPQAFITASEDILAVEDAMPRQSARYEAELKTPGGILFGAQDNILSPDSHGHPMKEYGLTHEMLEGGGHMILLTQPAACEDFIRRMAAAWR
jgi:pimeloyl-ACP methyl ester carboxylesterase